jgi:predicted SnoaL-like aldol condensation-catalyzing enzyme
MDNTKFVLLFSFSTLFLMNSISAQTTVNYDNKTIAQKTTLGRLEIKEAIAFSKNPFVRRNLMTTEMFFTQLNTLNFDAMSALFSNEFKQHAADVADGFGGFQNYVETKDNGSASSWNRFVDLNIVMGQKDHIVTMRKGNMNNLVFDVMKFNDQGLMSESWTYSQMIPKDTMNTRLMYDVAEEFARPVQRKSETVIANKTAIVEFIETAYQKGKRKKAAKKLMTEDIIQHHPTIADGIDAYSKSAKKEKYTLTTQQMIAQHDLVFVVSKAAKKGAVGEEFALVQMFRIRNGKICEMWEIWSTVPEKLAHTNGYF